MASILKPVVASTFVIYSAFSANASLAQTSLELCVEIDNNRDRLSCFDQAMSRRIPEPPAIINTSPNPVTIASPRPRTPPPATAEPRSRINMHDPQKLLEDDFGLELKAKPDIEEDLRTYTVATAKHNDFTGWTIVFENGQTWKQVGTDSYRIRKGQQYTIKRSAFNSFLLGNLNNNRNIRITRSE